MRTGRSARTESSPVSTMTWGTLACLTALVLVACSGCVSTPAPPAAEVAQVEFIDVTKEAGLEGAGAERCAWADYDNDGNVDVMIGAGLFRNNGDGTFTRVSDSVARGPGAWADMNNDGWLDFYNWAGTGALYRNQADGTFIQTEIPPNPHNLSMAAAWGDIDNDALVDLYVANYESGVVVPFQDLMIGNRGNDKFEVLWESPEGLWWSCRGANFADFDDDGDADLYLSNYRLQPNVLFINDGTGRFQDEAEARGVQGNPDGRVVGQTDRTPEYKTMGHTIGSCWGDLDNDADLDLVVVNFAHNWWPGQDHPMVCINSGWPAYTFTDINANDAAGIYWQESYAKGDLGDFDNDGDLDLYATTVYSGDRGDLFENDGTGKFKSIGDAKGLRTGASYQVAWADYDNDGDLDLLVAGRLFRNSGNSNSWLKVRVIGGRGSNAAAIGARVRLTAGDKVFIREVCGGNSGNQAPFVQHFGLGEYRDKVRVEVFFPSGKYGVWKTHPGKLLVARERKARMHPREMESKARQMETSALDNLARDATVAVSSTSIEWEGEGAPEAVLDGNLYTRWSSEYADNQFLIIDLGVNAQLDLINLRWEKAAPAGFEVALSSDARDWQTVSKHESGAPGPRADRIHLKRAGARFVRLDLFKRATEYGFSLYELEIWGSRQ